MEVKKLQERLEIIKDLICKNDDNLVANSLKDYESYNNYVSNLYNIFLGCGMLLTAFLSNIEKVRKILLNGKTKYPKAECNDKVDELLFRIAFYEEKENKRPDWKKKTYACQNELLEKIGIGFFDYDGSISPVIGKMIEAAQIYCEHENEQTHNLRDRLELLGNRNPSPKDGMIYLCHNTYFLYFVNCMMNYSEDVELTFICDTINIINASLNHQTIQTDAEKAHYRKTSKMVYKKINAYGRAQLQKETKEKAKTLRNKNAA